MHLAESGEMYLEAIHVLSEGGRPVRSVDVAEYLSLSKPSVSRAIGVLREGGYVVYDENKFLILTDSGREMAEKIYERHTILTKLLIELGVEQALASEDACKLEHAISDTSLAAIKRFLEHR